MPTQVSPGVSWSMGSTTESQTAARGSLRVRHVRFLPLLGWCSFFSIHLPVRSKKPARAAATCWLCDLLFAMYKPTCCSVTCFPDTASPPDCCIRLIRTTGQPNCRSIKCLILTGTNNRNCPAELLIKNCLTGDHFFVGTPCNLLIHTPYPYFSLYLKTPKTTECCTQIYWQFTDWEIVIQTPFRIKIKALFIYKHSTIIPVIMPAIGTMHTFGFFPVTFFPAFEQVRFC